MRKTKILIFTLIAFLGIWTLSKAQVISGQPIRGGQIPPFNQQMVPKRFPFPGFQQTPPQMAPQITPPQISYPQILLLQQYPLSEYQDVRASLSFLIYLSFLNPYLSFSPNPETSFFDALYLWQLFF
jgi:hypothetical protein